ncbi:MAG: hypothetical protein PF961_03965, partial [Planctomycetota bacterium]|nr:hypothetical protein [Planctomycetota bacterium]
MSPMMALRTLLMTVTLLGTLAALEPDDGHRYLIISDGSIDWYLCVGADGPGTVAAYNPHGQLAVHYQADYRSVGKRLVVVDGRLHTVGRCR